MDDGELQAIRAARIKELQAQQGGRAQTAGGAQQDNIDPETKRQQDAAGRHAMLSQILDAPARDRLSRIAIVKSDRARAVEDLIMRMAQGGQIRQKITESELVGLLEEISGQEAKKKESSKIIYNRRKTLDDSDDD